MTIRLLALVLLLLAPTGLLAQTASHAAFVKRVSDKLAYVSLLDCEALGRFPFTTRQFTRFDSLRRHCSNAELQLLAEHKSPVVRSYAFWALAERPDAELFTLLVRHRRDWAPFEQRCGCIGSTHYVADFMLDCYKHSPQYQADSLVAERQAFVATLSAQSTARFMRRFHQDKRKSWRQRYRQHRKYEQLLTRSDN